MFNQLYPFVWPLQAISVQSFSLNGLLGLNCRYLVGVTTRDQAVARTNFMGCVYCVCEYRPIYISAIQHIYNVFNDSISGSDCIASNDWMTENCALGRIWRGKVMARFNYGAVRACV